MAPGATISSTSYYKLYFHAAKHPHQPVNGVLLGQQVGNVVKVEDVIPLLHHWTSLSPMMEIGLDLAGQHADESGLKVVGYYQARTNVSDVGLGPVGEKILQRLQEKFKDAFGLVIDGEDFGTDKAALIPWIYIAESSQWKVAPGSEAFTPGSAYQLASIDLPTSAKDYVKQGLHQAFGDFDDHLEDVSIDWLRNRTCIPFEA
ncbi:hypothetical protein D9611_007472 [Ephemerocybe angulata]|uniref:MPN domain-containing protein n=1 Tax=Ephemerocybe angulata TaxID=980116 RepID=A0A8H5FL09_9AGAR|nr:hypothetical protein D9611_007472 [Tulosesus angulatus]